MRKKPLIMGVIVLITCVCGGVGVFSYVRILQKTPVPFSYDEKYSFAQDDAFLLNKPSVVRIVTTFDGSIDVPHFSVDPMKMEIIYNDQKPKVTMPIEDVQIMGSGHIVHRDGFVMTNAHVVSNQTLKSMALEEIFTAVFERDLMTFLMRASDNDIEKIQELAKKAENNDPELESAMEEMVKKLYTKVDLKITKKIVVLDPRDQSRGKEDVIKNGFEAKMVSVNDDYEFDEKDFALIKIDQIALPTVRYTDAANLVVGDGVHIFGFPASATFGTHDFTESTLTQGVVSALKRSSKGDFDIIQTDAKISSGSSGGPIFNKSGDVIGVITFQTNDDEKSGDVFAFAIPISIVKEHIFQFQVNKSIPIPEDLFDDVYIKTMSQAKQLLDAKHCQQALDKLAYANDLNESFDARVFAQKYTAECQQMIEENKSIDTLWDVKKVALAQIDRTTMIVAGVGGGMGIVLIIVIGILLIKVNKNRKAIETIENEDKIEDILHNAKNGENPNFVDAHVSSDVHETEVGIEKDQMADENK